VSQRTSRVDELLREEITRLLTREVQDPDIGFVTVTSVDVSADLRHASVWVSVIGDEAAKRRSIRALVRAMPFVRHQLGALRIRRIPELRVRYDDAAERGTRVLRILDELESGGPVEALPEAETLPIPSGRGTSEAAQEHRAKTARVAKPSRGVKPSPGGQTSRGAKPSPGGKTSRGH
jgi:ribosome-binding factor A